MVNSAKLRSPSAVPVSPVAAAGASASPPTLCSNSATFASGVLAQDIEQLDKVTDDLTRRQVRIGSHAAKLNLEKVYQVVLGKRGRPAKVSGMDLHEFFDQHQQLLVGEWLQAMMGASMSLRSSRAKRP